MRGKTGRLALEKVDYKLRGATKSFANATLKGFAGIAHTFGSSRNHVMFAEFVCWAYQYLAGIRLDESDDANGFKKVIIDPKPIAELNWARAEVKLANGTLAAGWERQANGDINITVIIPAGTEAKVYTGEQFEKVVGPYKGVVKRRGKLYK